ncbi:MAG: helicase, partial [Clostridia bacterium]|nr:helicase [Clostridia bacterium]
AERAIFAPFAFSVPQDAIDDILRNGSNTNDHRMILVAEFSKQKSLEDMTAAMRRVYHGGYGIATEHGRVTAWYAEDGMHFATGGTARYTRTAQVLSWTDAAKRIGELLEEGRFATNIEVAAALGHERRRMAEGMVNLYWDTDATAREQGYMPTLAGMCGGSHPACVEAATKALADPELLPAMLAEYKEFRAASKETPGLLRFRYRFIDELDALVNEYTMPRRDFDSSMPEVPKVAPFITNDEIAEAMSHGSSFASGKARIYDYFTQSHTPKEYADFLKKEYGIGGRSPALSSATHSSEDHDGKGLHYKKRDCPEIHLSWPQVVKQIQELIRMDRYLTPAEKAELEAIREMHDELVVVPDERILEATDLGISEPVIAAEPVQTQADQTRYQLMEIANREALFSNGRFDRESLPEGLFCYDIRDDSYGNAARLEPSVVVNHFGSIVTRQPIEFPAEGYIDLIENDDWTFENSEMTLAEFIQREMHSHELKDDSPVSPAEVAAVTENYRLLDRLRTDCEYFLGAGERNVRHLWAGGVREQIAKMRELYNALPEKPEWLTEEAIDSYAERMAPPYLVVAYHHFENGFDEKLDYQTLAEAEKAAQGYVDGMMEADGFQYDGAAVYDQQERQYLRIYGDFPDDKAQQQIAALVSPHQEEIPAEPAYRVGDTVYLDDRPFDITEISQSHVQLFDKTLPYPIFRSERLTVFEHLLALD